MALPGNRKIKTRYEYAVGGHPTQKVTGYFLTI